MASLAGRVARLNARDWRVVALAVTLTASVVLLLRVLPIGRAVRLLQSQPSTRVPGVASRRMMTVAIAVLSTLPVSCLTRALVLQRMLTWRGVPSTLVVGAAVAKGRLRAHAWLEFDGEVLIGGGDEAYAPLWTAPSLTVRGGAAA